ncbi:MAG: hypothetical protein U9Q74_10300 [Gemmatimonadota bacterium]|nr:hypothetical protein [Gemmatimonadota bacterium]
MTATRHPPVGRPIGTRNPTARRWIARAIAVGVAVAAVISPAAGQPTPTPAGVTRSDPAGGPDAPTLAPPAGRAKPRGSGLVGRDSAWWVPLASTALPGWGQIRLGQDRFVAYLAVEAYAVIGYFNDLNALHRERERFIGLARDVARAFVPGNNLIGDWDYYEAMEKHLESGVFDRSPGTGQFSPEVDTTTYNGAIWLRARRLSDWPNPDVEPNHASPVYQAAVSYYVAHAVRPEYRWSWRNAQLEWDLYRQIIRRKNDVGREAGHYLAAIAVNHLLSTIDAFITLRLRGGVGAPRDGYRLSLSVPFP